MKPSRRTADRLFLTEAHRIFRDQARRFVQERLAPHVDAWERDKGFPREVYREVAEAGLLGVGFDEAWGGSGGDMLHTLIFTEELIRSGSPGMAASLGSLAIALPPIARAGTDAQKARWMPKVLSGEWIAALAVTEPGAGSDVANITTRAVEDGDAYILNGAKTFITSGTRADLLTVVARTGGPGYGGVSLLAVETHLDGVEVVRNLDKMGWHASDTAELAFTDVRVPRDCLIGAPGAGFAVLMQNFATERLMLAVSAVEMAQLAFEEALRYTQTRRAFGRPLTGFQVTRHKLADMATRIDLCRTYNAALAQRLAQGDVLLEEVAIAKNASTDMACEVIDHAVQLHGGNGFMSGYLVERLYRDIRLYPIGGGTREIMNEIIARQLGL